MAKFVLNKSTLRVKNILALDFLGDVFGSKNLLSNLESLVFQFKPK